MIRNLSFISFYSIFRHFQNLSLSSPETQEQNYIGGGGGGAKGTLMITDERDEQSNWDPTLDSGGGGFSLPFVNKVQIGLLKRRTLLAPVGKGKMYAYPLHLLSEVPNYLSHMYVCVWCGK